jgi:hypothetical protein
MAAHPANRSPLTQMSPQKKIYVCRKPLPLQNDKYKYKTDMNKDIDMTYSFLQDDEPTDEQLRVIMREVAEDARRKRKKVQKEMTEGIEREYLRMRALMQNKTV